MYKKIGEKTYRHLNFNGLLILFLRFSKYFLKITEFINKNGLTRFLELRKNNINIGRYELFNKKWILDCNIRTVIDIGANIGEFTLIFDYIFNKPDIYSFEPLPQYSFALTKITQSKKNINFFNCALGEKESVEVMNVSSWGPSSSLLEMADLHKEMAPHSSGSSPIRVEVKRLDDLIDEKKITKNMLIKIDVQGFEKKVIEGGKKIFSFAKIVIIEMSYKELYKGEARFDNIYSLLVGLGFEFHGTLKQSVNSLDESYLQCDGIFINKNTVNQ